MKIHFIGIGGIGVSALAQYYLEKGHQVSGSDLAYSEITEALKKQGVKIIIGQKAKNLANDIDKVIYSPAVKEDNPELKKAYKIQNTKYKIQILSYPEALGELTKKHFTIAISGTHGKSTTTAMLALVLIKAGLNPTVIVGTKLKEFHNSNFRMGGKPCSMFHVSCSMILLIEACEHEESFLNYWPKIIVINNIEKDHLDYYKNLNNILKAFGKFIERLPEDGILIINRDDENIAQILTSSIKKSIGDTYGFLLKQKEVGKLRDILKVPGKHNIYNALAALTAARILKVPDKISFEALSEYKGVWRRFEIKNTIVNGQQIIVISDYAHHPTEIKATLSAAKSRFPKSKLWAIFQPHQYQRTFYLFNDFTKAFDDADEIILTKIYDVAGREDKKIAEKVSGKKLAEAIKKRGKKVHYIDDFEKIPQFIRKQIKPNDVILIMGAGSIYKLTEHSKH